MGYFLSTALEPEVVFENTLAMPRSESIVAVKGVANNQVAIMRGDRDEERRIASHERGRV